jgi:hypothetical protein
MKRSSIVLIILLTSSSISAQEAEVNEVTVKRIRPMDLPGLEETRIPAILGSKASMPRMPTQADIQSMQIEVAARTHRVLVAIKPLSTLQRDPIIMEGHAVWISAKDDGSDPVLVTPAHWVEGAARILVHPCEAVDKTRQLTAERATIKDVSVRARSALLDNPKLVSASVRVIDKGRNLAILEVDPEIMPPPKTGLKFFPIETVSLTHLYGLSPYAHFRPQIARILEPDRSDETLLYYLATEYNAAPGAPLVGPDGGLVALTAMHHPTEKTQTLILPPLAIEKFVRITQGLETINLIEDVTKPK